MKKSVMKSLAAFLVLALMVASLPVAVFAEEPEHCHGEMCCPDCETEVTAVNNCPAGGSHAYMSTPSATYRDCGEYHLVQESILHTCTKCGYSYHALTGATYRGDHLYTAGASKCILCGHIK